MDLSKASERTRKIHRALAQHPLGSAREIGDTLGEDPSTVANALRRADIGTHAKRKAVAAGEVEEGGAGGPRLFRDHGPGPAGGQAFRPYLRRPDCFAK